MKLSAKLGLFLATIALLSSLPDHSLLAAPQPPRPPELAQGGQPLDAVAQLLVQPPDMAKVPAEDSASQSRGEPPRFAIPITVTVTPATGGTWERLAGDRLLWRLRITSRGAISLNLGFARYHMPSGGKLWLYTPDYKIVRGPFTEADNEAHGELWTPILEGEELVVEVELPAAQQAALDLTLSSVNYGYHSILSFDKSGSCNVDVACSQADPYDPQVRSVAVYSTGGSRFCTGALINNTAQDGKPYFLTANHCTITAGNAASLVTYWNYENSTCRVPGSAASGQPGDGSLAQFMTGAIFRANYAPSDMTLVELDDPMNPAFNAYWAGWDRSGVDATRAVAIHHPNTDEKRISFENDPTVISSYGGAITPGDGTHVRVIDWDLGTTEPGSSGSPLFDQNSRIIGQLHGGGAACGNDLSDYYGRFFTSWAGGGTNATRLSNWLDPLGSGTAALNGRNQSLTLSASPSARTICALNDPTYTIGVDRDAGFTEPVALAASGNPAGTSASFSVNPVPDGTTSSVLTIGNIAAAAPGSYIIAITGTGTTANANTQVGLNLSTAVPSQPTLTAPANGITQQPLRPTFRWAAAAQAITYTLEVATDPGFTNIPYSAEVAGLSHTPSSDFAPDTLYFWRVRVANSCGEGPQSAPASFTAALIPCYCAPNSVNGETIYSQGFESGAAGWTTGDTGAVGDTWAVGSARHFGGTSAFHATDSAAISDQRLISPPIALPGSAISLTLQFQNYQDIELQASVGCYDAGLLEVSTDGGQSWAQVENAKLLTDPYDGQVSSVANNPLTGLQGWCGNPQDWLNSVVDISAYAGQTIQLRFRLGSDKSVGKEGWYIDDVRVQTCVAGIAPAFTSGALPSGVVGQPYGHTFSASGFPAATYLLAAGTLPPGLTLDPTTGALSGTPTTIGVFGPIVVTAANGIPTPATQTFTITISAPAITSAAPPAGAVGRSYSHTFAAAGLLNPTFVVSAGTLPPGLTLNPATGALSGRPTTIGVFGPITVTASSGAGVSATQTFTITITAADIFIPLVLHLS